MIAGKTTLLKSKAVSLASAGETVSYIVMGGSERTESVMSIATRLDFAQNHPTIKVISQQDLVEIYRRSLSWWWSPWPFNPSPLSLLKFYIEKEKPCHVMVDELPLEQPRWRQALHSVILSGSLKSLAFCFLLFLFASSWVPVVLPSMLKGLISYLHIFSQFVFMGLFVIFLVGRGFSLRPINLGKTSRLLLSLPPLLPSPSSTLWLALDSQPFTDIHETTTCSDFLRDSSLQEKDFKRWKNSLQSCFSIPTLKHNLRNCNEIADIKETKMQGKSIISISQLYAFQPQLHAPPPRAPPCLLPTPTFRPIYFRLNSPLHLMEAIRRAYNRMERPTHLVLLLTMKDYIRTAKDAFIQEGLNVVTYVTPDNSQDCKTFLQNPEGALITTPALFSGMEAINVILVMCKEDKRLVRSSTLRAIQQLCVVSIDSCLNPSRTGDFEIDNKFSICEFSLGETIHKCNNHPSAILCHTCAIVCHQTCEVKKHWLRFILVFIFAGFPPFNHCSCSTLGRCLLESRSSVSKASLFWIAVEIVTLAVFVIVWAASGDLGLSLLGLFFGSALFLFLHKISSCLQIKHFRFQRNRHSIGV